MAIIEEGRILITSRSSTTLARSSATKPPSLIHSEDDAALKVNLERYNSKQEAYERVTPTCRRAPTSNRRPTLKWRHGRRTEIKVPSRFFSRMDQHASAS